MTPTTSVHAQAAELVRWLDALRELGSAAASDVDPHDVLNLVAATARELLGFDFCGVLTPDAARESLVITGWSGLSREYVSRVNSDRPVRLDSTAPSSRAFHRGQPVALSDISAEAGFSPWGGVAREEGYGAIVCVPLIAGSDVLGTLNGYYRAEHEFADVEVQRLTLLANHAAVALSSARMLDELRALTASLREQRDALSRSERIHQRLLAVTLRSGGMEGIAAVLAELLGRPVLIEDARHEVLAAAGDRAGLPPPQRRGTAEFPDDASSEPLPSPAENAGGFLVSTARLNGEAAARIWLPDSPGLDAIGVRAVEHASIVVALELLRVRTGAEAEHRLRGELLVELLGSPNPPAKALITRAGLLGHDLSGPHIAMVGTAPDPAGGQFYQRVLSAVSDTLRGYRPRPVTAMYRGNIVVLWPTTAGGSAEAARLVQRTMTTAAGADATLAVYRPGDGGAPRHYQSYRIAKGALEIALRTGRGGTLVELADLGIAGLLLQLDDTAQLVEFADRTLGPVLDYDHRHRTELLDTLRVYLDCRLDRGATAAQVHIHPNTVGQRIRRIERLCGIELSDPSTAARFSTALTVRDVAQRNR